MDATILSLGTYHQYDTIAYPRMKDTKDAKTWTAKIRLPKFLKSQSNPHSSQEIGKICLEAYLDDYKKTLSSGNFCQPINIHKFVEEINHIYSSLLKRVTHLHGNVETATDESLKEVSSKPMSPVCILLSNMLSLFLTVCRS